VRLFRMPRWSGEPRDLGTSVKFRPPISWSRLSEYEGSPLTVDSTNLVEGRWRSPVTVGLQHVTTHPDARGSFLGRDCGGSLVELGTGRSMEPRAFR
jgi:hypothetical protein